MEISVNLSGIQLIISSDKAQPRQNGMILSGACVTTRLPLPPKRFYRHGWQSWSLACWLDPSQPPARIRSAEFRNKDEDPPYALAENHVSAWVGAVELVDHQVLLLGALNLGGRVELDSTCLNGFFEAGYPGNEWFLAHGEEREVFAQYAGLLAERFGRGCTEKAARVWCSWYSLYNLVNERVIHKVLDQVGDLPFDVIQLDDGWEIIYGDWEANRKFPSGMGDLAARIAATGRKPGLWLAPLMVMPKSKIFREHPDWLLRNEKGEPVPIGFTWGGSPYALDTSHPDVLDWLGQLICKVRGWGYQYLKLDFLYAGAIPGKRYKEIPREIAYRNALQVMREAAGDAYILACGAPIFPSLGLCDGLRVGPDVTPYWHNTPMSTWLNNPNHPGTRNAIRTSLHRLWLQPLVNVDPDVIFFRSRHNGLKKHEKGLLRDLGRITGFKATSDIPQWLKDDERRALREFLENDPVLEHLTRYRFRVGGQDVDFEPVMLLPDPVQAPAKLATALGLYNMLAYEILPAVVAASRNNIAR